MSTIDERYTTDKPHWAKREAAKTYEEVKEEKAKEMEKAIKTDEPRDWEFELDKYKESLERHKQELLAAQVGLLGQPVTAFDSGAVRGTDASGTRYDLISPHILTALAEAYAEGAQKYGDDNWLKGIPSKDLMNHALRHIVLWQTGDNSEDHLGHAMWNIGAIIHFQKTRPELIIRQYATKPKE